MERVHINKLIDQMNISDKMKREFKNLNFMYYNNYADGVLRQPYFWKESPEFLSLSDEMKKEIRKEISKDFRILIVLLNFIGYFLRGLFLKGVIFGVIILTLAILVPESAVKIVGAFSIYFLAMNVNKDYFYEKCLKNERIKEMISNRTVIFKPDAQNQTIIKGL